MTYITPTDQEELNKIDKAIDKIRKLNEDLTKTILKKISNDFNYHDPKEDLTITIDELIYKLNVYRLKINYNGIESFSENEKRDYKNTLSELKSLEEKF